MKYFKSDLPEIQITYSFGEEYGKRFKISSSEDAYAGLHPLYDDGLIEYQESCVVLFLNKANHTIGFKEISKGGTSGTIVDIKTIMGIACKTNTHALILSHNHPSGKLSPSDSDRTLTQTIKSAAQLFDIKVLDHIILTKENYFSFADEGLL